MNIAVLVKYVPVSDDVKVDPITHALVRDSSEGMINPADLNAIEAALSVKESAAEEGLGEVRVTAFSMGPDGAKAGLRDALAIGCDEACLISDRAFAGGDTVATAVTVAEGIKKYGSFDLILCGALSSDGATGQVGAMAAEYLGISHIAEVQSVCVRTDEASGLNFAVKKRYHGGIIEAEVCAPALISVCFGCNEPRLATLRSKKKAKEKEITVYTNTELALGENKTGFGGSPTLVTDSFEAEKHRTAEFLAGTPQEMAEKILGLVEERKGSK